MPDTELMGLASSGSSRNSKTVLDTVPANQDTVTKTTARCRVEGMVPGLFSRPQRIRSDSETNRFAHPVRLRPPVLLPRRTMMILADGLT